MSRQRSPYPPARLLPCPPTRSLPHPPERMSPRTHPHTPVCPPARTLARPPAHTHTHLHARTHARTHGMRTRAHARTRIRARAHLHPRMHARTRAFVDEGTAEELGRRLHGRQLAEDKIPLLQNHVPTPAMQEQYQGCIRHIVRYTVRCTVRYTVRRTVQCTVRRTVRSTAVRALPWVENSARIGSLSYTKEHCIDYSTQHSGYNPGDTMAKLQTYRSLCLGNQPTTRHEQQHTVQHNMSVVIEDRSY